MRYMTETNKKIKHFSPVLQPPMNRLIDMVNPNVLKALSKIEIGKTLMDKLGGYFPRKKFRHVKPLPKIGVDMVSPQRTTPLQI